jgi:hypothetical protein
VHACAMQCQLAAEQHLQRRDERLRVLAGLREVKLLLRVVQLNERLLARRLHAHHVKAPAAVYARTAVANRDLAVSMRLFQWCRHQWETDVVNRRGGAFAPHLGVLKHLLHLKAAALELRLRLAQARGLVEEALLLALHVRDDACGKYAPRVAHALTADGRVCALLLLHHTTRWQSCTVSR